MADTKPYGDVTYADPGYLDAAGNPASKTGKPGVKRYPLTADKVQAAWSYINQAKNAGQYTTEQLASIKAKITAAMKKSGHQVNAGRSEQAMDVERRYTPGTVEVRMDKADQNRIGGYAAVFGKLSRNLGGFVERVEAGFFNQSRADGWPGVICRYNHDDNMLLGTVGGGTLALQIDDQGLRYEVEPPAARNDVLELVKRGDVRNSSFAFQVIEDDWATTDGAYPMRSLVLGKCVDVAPVNSPAYPDATAGLRSLAAHFDAPFEDVTELAQADELRKFFVTTGASPVVVKKKPNTWGTAAKAAIALTERDPWA